MLKTIFSLEQFERQCAEALKGLLAQVPLLDMVSIEQQMAGPDNGVDLVAHVSIGGRRHELVCQIKASGQPRHARMATLDLRSDIPRYGEDATPVLIAPYLSPEAQDLCRREGVGFLDLEGNARLVFDGVFIERQVATKPPAERRELRSIFKPKSAQVLRVLLRDPARPWRVTELATATDVSLGHVSNVRTALLDREWAEVTPDGLILKQPDALLDNWRDAYEAPAGKRLGFYTVLHGAAFEEAARRALGVVDGDRGAILASFSAAQWLAPYARTGSQFLYADETGLEALRKHLALIPATHGENVVVTVLDDRGPLRDTIEPAQGIVCTSPAQTYLDLAAAGERGREAADHLRREILIWPR